MLGAFHLGCGYFNLYFISVCTSGKLVMLAKCVYTSSPVCVWGGGWEEAHFIQNHLSRAIEHPFKSMPQMLLSKLFQSKTAILGTIVRSTAVFLLAAASEWHRSSGWKNTEYPCGIHCNIPKKNPALYTQVINYTQVHTTLLWKKKNHRMSHWND